MFVIVIIKGLFGIVLRVKENNLDYLFKCSGCYFCVNDSNIVNVWFIMVFFCKYRCNWCNLLVFSLVERVLIFVMLWWNIYEICSLLINLYINCFEECYSGFGFKLKFLKRCDFVLFVIC